MQKHNNAHVTLAPRYKGLVEAITLLISWCELQGTGM